MREWVASGFGTGRLPPILWGGTGGGGTLAAIPTALIGLALWDAPPWIGAVFAVGAVAVSLWAAAPFGDDDPAWITIDEVAGTAVAMIGLSGWPWLVAVVVGRLADIFKTLPGIRAAERLPGSIGITADDVLAGIYGLAAGVVVALVR